jgi:small subunit ribosomal protein S21
MQLTLVSVDCSKGDINKSLKEFKRKVINSGHIQELRDRKEYKKPTTVRREEKQKAIRKEKYKHSLDLFSPKKKGKGDNSL